jgi:hypothetical protein
MFSPLLEIGVLVVTERIDQLVTLPHCLTAIVASRLQIFLPSLVLGAMTAPPVVLAVLKLAFVQTT